MIKVKSYKQSKGYCGPTSLRIVLSHHGISKSEKYLAKLIGASREKGCDEKGLLKAAKEFGFKGYWKEKSSINELKKLVKKEIPVIVNWFSPEQDGHYSVVIGFEKNKIIMVDPHFGEIRKMRIDQFLVRWFDFEIYPAKNRSELFLRRIIVIHR